MLAAALAADWTSFRGANSAGVAPDARPPLTWSPEKNVRWKTVLPGLSHGNPIVVGDRVYVLTAVASEGQPKLESPERMAFAKDVVKHFWRLLCFDAKSGKLRWDRVVHEGTPHAARHVKATYANATPAAAGQRIVLFAGAEAVVGVDLEGRVQWTARREVVNPKEVLDPASSPLVWEDRVFVASDWVSGSSLAALDLATGRELWKVQRNEGSSWATPVINAAGDLVMNSGRWIRGLDPRTGEERWKLNASGKQLYDRIPTPVVTAELTIVGGGGPEGRLFAVRNGARGELTEANGIAWSVRGAPYLPSPLAHEGLLYVLFETGVLRVLRAASGERVYEQRVAADRFTASPVLAGGRLYLTGESGETFVVRAGEQYELLAANKLDELVMATPAVAGRQLLVRTGSRLYALGE